MSIIQDLQLDIGITQLKHTLKDLGYNHRMARCRPFLKKLDRKRRFQFANRHAHFMVENWKAFIWTDEMSVKVGMQRSTRDWYGGGTMRSFTLIVSITENVQPVLG